MVSMSTRCDTHAPPSTNRSAAAACLASSLVIRRTRTLVSTARMTRPYVAPDAVLQFPQRPRFRRTREERLVQVPRRVPSDSPDDHLPAVLVPLDDGARSNAELLPHFRGH